MESLISGLYHSNQNLMKYHGIQKKYINRINSKNSIGENLEPIIFADSFFL